MLGDVDSKIFTSSSCFHRIPALLLLFITKQKHYCLVIHTLAITLVTGYQLSMPSIPHPLVNYDLLFYYLASESQALFLG